MEVTTAEWRPMYLQTFLYTFMNSLVQIIASLAEFWPLRKAALTHVYADRTE